MAIIHSHRIPICPNPRGAGAGIECDLLALFRLGMYYIYYFMRVLVAPTDVLNVGIQFSEEEPM